MTRMGKGMSMVEVMIGAFILALVLIPSMNVIISDTRSVTATRDHVSAAFLGQKMFEWARSFKFDNLDAEPYAADPGNQRKTLEWILKNDQSVRKQTINAVSYEVTNVNVEPVRNRIAPDDPPSVVLLSFSIEYKSPDGKAHRLDLSTAIPREE